MTIPRRIAAAKEALREARTRPQVLSVANRCDVLLKECDDYQADEVSAAILEALERVK